MSVLTALMLGLIACSSSTVRTGRVPITSPTTQRYDDLPGAPAVSTAQREQRSLVKIPRIHAVDWTEDGGSVRLSDGTSWRTHALVDGTLQSTEAVVKTETDETAPRSPRRRGQRVPRGAQATEVSSPDEQWTAKHRDHNVVLVREGGHERMVTQRGTAAQPFGTASWVYGEELDQSSAMWFSPNSSMLAFYAFDVSEVPDYHLLHGLDGLRPTIDTTPYPKPGDPNPIAGLQLYDINLRRLVTVDVGPRHDQYIYGVQFTPDSRYLLAHRLNRAQNHLELLRVDPRTGRSTVLFEETQPTWVHYEPEIRWLADGHRFLIATERSGYRTWEVWDVDDGQLTVLGPATFPSGQLVRVQEDDALPGGGQVWFAGTSGDHPLNTQLHVVNLDGSGFRRLTDQTLHHGSFHMAPDGVHVVTTAQNSTTPPRILLQREGAPIAVLEEADVTALDASGRRVSELFNFSADDGQTCFGRIHYPSNFDPGRRWPVLVQVYGGPLSRSIHNTFDVSSARSEFGFVIVQIDNRGTTGRGKAFEGATYNRLGQVDLDDQAAGVRELAQRHTWFDADRVAIAGHSYGGYMSALALLRHPDVFHAAVASAPVTDWRHYDTIYTERYMGQPADNEANYDAGSCVKQAEHLRGHLLLLHGMADDNVHPSNAWALADALHDADIPFEMHFFPGLTHGLYGKAVNSAKWSFIHRHLLGED
ncbi:MAG: S9 family peptidase [Phycisphaerales bacterium]|nr:S9 family peptidase [Phycisphaerales bacterium]